MRKNGWLSALAALAFAFAASAADLHVPSQYATIQAAVAASARGDVVIVAPGTYNESIDLMGRHLTLRSSGGAAVTTLDGAGLAASILIAMSGESAGDTIVRGFTFRNGYGVTIPACALEGRKGGAIFVLNAGLAVLDSVFEENGEADEVAGGAIFACQSDLAVVASRFERNGGSFGGGIDFIGTSTRRLTVEHSTFVDNEAGHGGGIKADLFGNSALAVRNCRFDGNDGGHGGGIAIVAPHRSTLAIERSTFDDNGRGGTGGGVKAVIDGTTSLTMTDARFTDNEASHGAGLYVAAFGESRATIAECDFARGVSSFGAGAHLTANNSAAIDLLRSDFTGHEASFGGGVFATAARSLPEDAGGRIRIDGCRFLENVAHSCCNTGIYYDSCFIDGVPPRGNGLYYGGGADLRTITGGSITVASSLFAGNSGTRGGGASASSCAGGTIDLLNTTIVENDQNALHVRFGTPRVSGPTGMGQVRVANSILRGNAGGAQVVVEKPDGHTGASVTFSNVEGGLAGEGNFDLDPLFVDPQARDYRLSEGSMCIDAGDNAALRETIARDVTGRARFVDDPRTRDTGRGEGPVVDVGAYEFQPGRRRTVRR